MIRIRNIVHCTANNHVISVEQSSYLMGSKKAGEVAETSVLVMDETTYVADAAREMRRRGVSSVIVSKGASKEPVGIVTERDILYRLVAEHRSPFKVVLKDVMSSPLVVIDEAAPIKDAIVLLRKSEFRRLPVTKGGKVMGLLTLELIVGDSQKSAIELIDIGRSTDQVVCPYCGSKFDDKEILSKHIDRLHLGSGLLEGDLRQW